MLDEMGKSIDAVTVSTADHSHAPAALMAMRLGKHCFCQKPLTRTLYEARLMGQVARQMKVATQMGNQGTASDGLRRGAALLRAGAIGNVQEIHIWTNRPIWPQGQERPQGEDPVPTDLAWDLWLGPAPVRPYKAKYVDGPNAAKPVYHPFVWRGWWDFGSARLGDMGCHEINLAYMGLDLRDPVSVQAVTSGHNRDSFPAWSIVTYEFAANSQRPAAEDGLVRRREEAEPRGCSAETPAATAGWWSSARRGRFGGASRSISGSEQEVTFPKSPGHFEEWVRAIRGGEPAMSNFPDYAGPLAETVLLGNLAVWAAHEINSSLGDEKAATGEKIEWDAEKLAAKKRARPGRPHQTRLSRGLYARCLIASVWKRS